MWSGSGKINKATSNYVSKTTSKPSKKKQILLWNDVLSLKKVHTTRKVRNEMFFSLYQIFEDAIYGYTIILGPDHLDSLLLKKIELAKNIVKFFLGHMQKHKNSIFILTR